MTLVEWLNKLLKDEWECGAQNVPGRSSDSPFAIDATIDGWDVVLTTADGTEWLRLRSPYEKAASSST